MKRLALIIVLISSNAWAYRSQEDTVGESFTYTVARLMPGYGYGSLLNSDGTKAVFAGPHIAGDFDVVFSFEDINLAIGPSVHGGYYQYQNLKNGNGIAQQLSKSDLLYGLKAYFHPFYVGFGYGTTNVVLSESSGYEIGLKAQQLGFTGGLHLFKLSKTLNFGFTGWYKSSFFHRSNNPRLQDNTSLESLEFYLTISIHPLFQIL